MPNGSSEPARLNLSSKELASLASAVLERQFGTPFFYRVIGNAAPDQGPDQEYCCPLPEHLETIAGECAADWRPTVRAISDSLQALAIPLRNGQRTALVAIGIFASQPLPAATRELILPEWLTERVAAHQVRFCQGELLLQLGESALATIHERWQLAVRDTELKQLAAQLTRNYEEITLLHQLTREAQISQGAASLQLMTISLLAEMLPAPQVAYVSCHGDEAVVTQGLQIVDPNQIRELMRHLEEQTAGTVLVDNRLGERALPETLSKIGRLVSVPVMAGKEQFGWLIALGRPTDPDVGSVEASLMGAVAAILATHQTNLQLYRDIKDLFLGIVRALTSAIDAKDPYTSGHSERVARLAYQIAERLGLPEDQQNKVYLSGLLHDVGKIGIRDAILLKTGRLTDEELAHMKQHPTIGFDILSAVRQLQPVLSGVRSHHENVDGTGYPDRLKGNDIPLMARIVAAADSYDAMNSDRLYRPALRLDQIKEIFRAGSNKQWDASVVDVLLEILHESEQKGTYISGPNAGETPASLPLPLAGQPFASMDLSSLRPSSFDRH